MRREDELLDIVRGSNPMMPPQDEMMDMPPEMPPGMEDPMMDPMEMEPGGDMNLPKSATVVEVQGNMVMLEADNGMPIKLSIDAFPIPPQEGMVMVQAVVEDISDGTMMASVNGMPVDLPLDGLQANFEIGDYFWMPEPPAGPEDLDMIG